MTGLEHETGSFVTFVTMLAVGGFKLLVFTSTIIGISALIGYGAAMGWTIGRDDTHE